MNVEQVRRHLGPVLDARQEAHFAVRESIHRLRVWGATWDQIGAAMGVSRQAAQQRYGDWRDPARALVDESLSVDGERPDHPDAWVDEPLPFEPPAL